MTYKTLNEHNEVLGITTDNRLIIIDYTFEYSKVGEECRKMPPSCFKGATKIEMRPLTQAEVDKGNDYENARDYCYDLWKSDVANDNTTSSLDDYIEDFKNDLQDRNELFYGDDSSYREETLNAIEIMDDKDYEKLVEIVGVRGKDFVDWTCESCGRIGQDYKKWEWKALFKPDLLKEVAEYEGGNEI